ncbi:MAG: isoprenoid biosynthesis protein ElbB [Alphaproteobacteria bacterium CG11_big_fil_rev_8_21_14_0_20_44_7]|nr:MAG: isoprenoid biosynthesis protein ElbB [Alphaproteobacteria bacterium CG11_big_fil_rev_8_21_14_0_20_44_7]
MKKVAVILSGCGHLDGAEIRESVLTLLYLDKKNAEIEVFAPDINQHHVINHLSGEETSETRNVLIESARIARGKIAPLTDLKPDNFDALIMPGGYGAAKNLSDFAFKGANAVVNDDLKKIVKSFLEARKPIGAICISPAVLVAAIKCGTVTIGDDEETASAINQIGGKHLNCATNEICIDEERKIVSTSAYMRDDSLAKISDGIEQLVNKVIELI